MIHIKSVSCIEHLIPREGRTVSFLLELLLAIQRRNMCVQAAYGEGEPLRRAVEAGCSRSPQRH